MSSRYKYRAFISYSHADRDMAAWLHSALERYRIPKELTKTGGDRLFPIFQDREELATSSDLSEAIQNGLIESENLVVLCSPHAAASQWVNEEVEVFRRLHREQRFTA